MADQIGTPRLPIRVLGVADTQIDVSGTATPEPLTAFAWHPNGLASPNSSRNSHRVGLRFLLPRARVGSPHRNRPQGAVKRLIERDQDVPLDILASQRRGGLPPWFPGFIGSPVGVERRTAARLAGASAEKLLKKNR